MLRAKFEKPKGAAVLITLAVVQFAALQMLVSADASAMFAREVRRVPVAGAVRPGDVRWAKLQRLLPRTHRTQD